LQIQYNILIAIRLEWNSGLGKASVKTINPWAGLNLNEMPQVINLDLHVIGDKSDSRTGVRIRGTNQEELKLETHPDIQDITLTIQSINGKLVKRAKKFKINNGVLHRDIDLSSQLKQGVYFFVFTIGEETITKQIVIK